MSTELHNPDSSQPPDPHLGRQDRPTPQASNPNLVRRDDREVHSNHSEWTWPAATVTCVVVLATLGFAGFLIEDGHDMRITGFVALAIVVGIVAIILPTPSRRAVLRRIGKALRVLMGDDEGQGGAR